MAQKSKKPAGKSPARKPAAKKAAAKSAAPVRLALSKSNYCPNDGRLLRADRTCPVTDCEYHDKPVPA